MRFRKSRKQSVRYRNRKGKVGCETAAFGQMAAGDGGKGDDLVEVVGGTSGREKQSGAEQQQQAQEQEQEQRRRVVSVGCERELMGGQERMVNGMGREKSRETSAVSDAREVVVDRDR